MDDLCYYVDYELLRICVFYMLDDWSCLSSGFIESVERPDNWNTQRATAFWSV